MKDDMRILFAGGRNAGRACLEHLVRDGANIVGVMAREDSTEKYNSPYHTAKELGIPIVSNIEGLNPNVLLSVYYHKRIPKELLDRVPTRINFHGGILPDYKGCNSNIWTILNGDIRCGATAHVMEESFDSGEIVGQLFGSVGPKDTGKSVYRTTEGLTMALFMGVYSQLKNGTLQKRPQPKGGKYYTKELPNDGYIDPLWSAEKAERFVRAMYFPPYKPARLSVNGKDLYITKAHVNNGELVIDESSEVY